MLVDRGVFPDTTRPVLGEMVEAICR